MPVVNHGGGGTGSASALNQYLKYNPVTKRIEASRPVQTTLHSLYFGDMHAMSSTGSNVMWTNQETGAGYNAVGTAVGPHAQQGGEWVANQPTSRYYHAFNPVEFGTVGDGSFVFDYNSTDVLYNTKSSEWGHEWVAGEAYKGTLTYKISLRPSDRVITYREYDVDVQVGDAVKQLFMTPVDIYSGDLVHFELQKEDSSYMKIRSTNANDKYWVKVFIREFEDRSVPFEQQVADQQLAMSYEAGFDKYLQDSDGQYIIDSEQFIEMIGAGELLPASIGDQLWFNTENLRVAGAVGPDFLLKINGSGHTRHGSVNMDVTLSSAGVITFGSPGTYIIEFDNMLFSNAGDDAINMQSANIFPSASAAIFMISRGWYLPNNYSGTGINTNHAIIEVKTTADNATIYPDFISQVVYTMNAYSTFTIKRVA